MSRFQPQIDLIVNALHKSNNFDITSTLTNGGLSPLPQQSQMQQPQQLQVQQPQQLQVQQPQQLQDQLQQQLQQQNQDQLTQSVQQLQVQPPLNPPQNILQVTNPHQIAFSLKGKDDYRRNRTPLQANYGEYI